MSRSCIIHAAAAALAWVLLAGCSSGHIELASLDYRSINPPGTRASKIEAYKAYWWTDEHERVWIALRRDVRLWFGPFDKATFMLSLRLDALPRGQAREYKLNADSLRALYRAGPAETRFTSAAGIADVYRQPGNRLRGGWRIQASREVKQLIGGWSRGTRYLMLGEFKAVFDPEAGRAIAAETESNGFEREPPAIQPAE